jgi:hypothetical protein
MFSSSYLINTSKVVEVWRALINWRILDEIMKEEIDHLIKTAKILEFSLHSFR